MINIRSRINLGPLVAFILASLSVTAQNRIPKNAATGTVNDGTESYRQVRKRAAVWTEAYNRRDSVQFYSLFDSAAIVTSAGGSWIGLEQCKDMCRGLYRRRPDITWNNAPAKIEVNEQWQVAYETGDWTESWTQKGDTGRSEIKGKYWIMWAFKNDDWHILSAIYTPMSCTGSYCK